MINIFDISTLVTDRTQADVQAWNEKGTYNPSDLNRVTHAMEYLVERIRSYGYAVKYEKVKVPHQQQKGKSRLPAGYTELEYIESTGTQYIDTGFVPNQDTRVVMEAEHSVTSAVSWIFGVRTASGKNMYAFLAYQNKYRTDYNTTITSYGTAITAMTKVDKDKNITTLNGTEVITNAYASFDCQYPLFLLAMNTAGTASGFASAKVKIMKIYDNGAIVRNYVPCKDSNGEIGLYDLVNKSFVGNSGSGEFLAGGEIIPRQLPEGYTQVTYIQSSGTQYIDTGFKPNQDTRVMMEVDILSATSVNAVSNTYTPAVFGARNSSTSASFTLWLLNTTSFRTDFGGANVSISVDSVVGRYAIDKNKTTTSVNTSTAVNTAATFQASYPLTLFALNNAGSVDARMLVGRLYSCKIYDNNALIRDLIPCTNASGAAGLYDIVNGIFYGNAGTGVFTVGTEVELPPAEILDDYTWYHSDIPQERELTAYLQNVNWLREAMVLYPNTPEVPDDMESFTFAEANDIEMILVNIETIINLMLSSIIYSGEIFSGEVI